jgi:hypothetical protein
MQNYMFIFNEWWYVLILASVMIISGLVKQYSLFEPVYSYLIKKVKNKKILVVLLSFLGGVLPIPGRVIVSAGLLDTIAPIDPPKRAKFGIVDYLATHHYYLWSPLEKTILIPMAVLKLSYLGVLAYTWPLLLVSLLFLIGYIVKLASDDVYADTADFLTPKDKPAYKAWYQFINWNTLILVGVVIIAGNFIKEYSISLKGYVETVAHGVGYGNFTFFAASLMAFTASLIMGSSGKFAGMTALLTSIFGLPYLTYIFAIEFAGYLLSPCHKCVAIGMSYFNTPMKDYYKVILLWSALLISVGIITLFI